MKRFYIKYPKNIYWNMYISMKVHVGIGKNNRYAYRNAYNKIEFIFNNYKFKIGLNQP